MPDKLPRNNRKIQDKVESERPFYQDYLDSNPKTPVLRRRKFEKYKEQFKEDTPKPSNSPFSRQLPPPSTDNISNDWSNINSSIMNRMDDSFYNPTFNKKVDRAAKDALEWHNEYINSPKYKERLTNFYSNPDEVVHDRLKGINNLSFSVNDSPLYGKALGAYTPYTNQIIMYKEPNRNGVESLDAVLAHEISHRNNIGGFNNSLSRKEKQYLEQRNKYRNINISISDYFNTDVGHDKKAVENKSTIDELRYLLKKNKIYDAGTQDFDTNILKYIREKGTSEMKNTLKKLPFEDKDLIDIMNKVAISNNQNNIPVAKYGKKMPVGGKVKKKPQNTVDAVAPKGVRPNTLNENYIPEYTNFSNIGAIPLNPALYNQSPSRKLANIEDAAYERVNSSPRKVYPIDPSNSLLLTQGKMRGAKPNPNIIKDLVNAADQYGIDRNTMVGLAAQESMFGKGYMNRRGGAAIKEGGPSQQDIVSGWDVANDHNPISVDEFAYKKGVPHVAVIKNKLGYMFARTSGDFNKSLDSTLQAHPEYIEEYRKLQGNIKPQGDINYFNKAAEFIKNRGLGAYNPGDPDYPNKIKQVASLVKNEPVIQQIYKDMDSKKKMKNGGKLPKLENGGGLSRNKDYKSSKKPYPSVKSSDFAGSHRSYPIPTRADAVDALRLAGLHGREDVKAKVYKKYPDLKKAQYGMGIPPLSWEDQYSTLENPIYYEDNTGPGVGRTFNPFHQVVSDYFKNDPYKNMVPNNASLNGPNPYENEFVVNPSDNSVQQTDYYPIDPKPKDKKKSNFNMDFDINPGQIIGGLFGAVNQLYDNNRGIKENARLKRNMAMSQSYNPYQYGTGSQAIYENGGVIEGAGGNDEYELTDDQIDFLKSQGYDLEILD